MITLLSEPNFFHTYLFAQSGQTSPLPNVQSTDFDLLLEQINYLKATNSNLTESVNHYISFLQNSVLLIGLVITVITLFGSVIFGSSLLKFRSTLKSINQKVEQTVRREVQKEVALLVRDRVEKLEMILARENIISQINIDYVIPIGQITNPEQNEKRLLIQKILAGRGFSIATHYLSTLNDPDEAKIIPPFTGNIIVLDLFSLDIIEGEREKIIKRAIAKVPFQSAAFIAHFAGYSNEINSAIANGHFCSAANSPMTLTARVIEASIVIDSLELARMR